MPLSLSSSSPSSSSEDWLQSRFMKLQESIGSDAGGRGMKALIVPGDLLLASQVLERVCHRLQQQYQQQQEEDHHRSTCIVILSGFPCCIAETPPTETDGPPGACALAKAALSLTEPTTTVSTTESTTNTTPKIVLAVDECNAPVFQAACAKGLMDRYPVSRFALQSFAASTRWTSSDDEDRLQTLARDACLVIACERAGPARDGNCYTMRGKNMTSAGLIAPLHRLVQQQQQGRDNHHSNNNPPFFLAIGDGGNELGMGKVIQQIQTHIPMGETIGCVIAADHLIAASVSNWGAYALAAGAALVRAAKASDDNDHRTAAAAAAALLETCLPTEQDEIDLLNRCVAAGCRDGVSGNMEATVDGMPLERSLQCLREIRSLFS